VQGLDEQTAWQMLNATFTMFKHALWARGFIRPEAGQDASEIELQNLAVRGS
jgi:hypothetical protein